LVVGLDAEHRWRDHCPVWDRADRVVPVSLLALAAVLADTLVQPPGARHETTIKPDPEPGKDRPRQARDTLRTEISLFERSLPGWRAVDLGTQWIAITAGTMVHADTLHDLEQAVCAVEQEPAPEWVRPYIREHEDLPWPAREAAPPARGGIAC